MKVSFAEHDGCFGICIHPETPEDTLNLIRFGMLATKEIRYCGTDVPRQGTGRPCQVTASIVLGKSKRGGDQIPKAK